jgi:hypothetical protein
MALDPNIALGVRGIELPNQLAQYGQLSQIQNAQNQNALAQFQLGSAQRTEQSQNLLANAYAQSTDPATGKIDYNKLTGLVAAGGGGAQIPAIQKSRLEQDTAGTKLLADKLALLPEAYKRADTPEAYFALHKFVHNDPVLGPFLNSTGATPEKGLASLQNAVQNGKFNELRMGSMQSVSQLLESMKPLVVGASSSVYNPQTKTYTQAPAAPLTPSPTNKLLQERAALIESGVPPTDPRIQAYDQALAAGESQSMKLQRELQIAIANKAPPAVIAQLERDIRNLHPGLAMQNVVGVDANGNQIVTRLAGAGGGPQGQFALNQSPTGTARAMLGLSEADSALLFGPGGPVELGQIPVNKLNASNAKMYVAAIKANPTLNLATLNEDQLLQASKAKAQGNIQGKQVLTLADRETAKNIANGNIPPLTGPNSTRIMNEVIAMKPDFKASDYGLQTSAVKAFNQGIQGNKVRSLNVVMDHFTTLEKAADALQSGDVRAINAVSQYIQTQTGKPAPGNFNAVKEILADEIIAAVVPGVGALADRVALKKTILAASSPEQLKGIVANYKELIGGQLNGLEKQYSAGTGRTDFKSRYLTPAAVQGLVPTSQYVETKTLPDGRTLGKKADGTVEEIK